MEIKKIIVKDRLRKLDQEKVRELAESIKESGLINPITITKDYRLLAGHRRLAACKLLGLDDIEVNIVSPESELDEELIEIDENLIRDELHYIDRADQLKRRQEIYELKYPESKKGGDRKSDKFQESKRKDSTLKSFTQDTAKKTGKSQSKIQKDLKLSDKLSDEVKDKVIEMDLPQAEATKLSRYDRDYQKEIISKMEKDNLKYVGQADRELESEKFGGVLA